MTKDGVQADRASLIYGDVEMRLPSVEVKDSLKRDLK